MRLSQILNEDISINEARKHLVDVFSTEIPAVLERMRFVADRHATNYTPKRDDGRYLPFSALAYSKALRFVLGSQTSKWYKDVFWTRVRPSLYAYARYNQKYAKPLADYLSMEDLDKFSGIPWLLGSLASVASKAGDRAVLSAVSTARHAFDRYEDYISSTEAKAADMHGATYDDDYDSSIPSRAVSVSRRDPSELSVVRRDTGVAGYVDPGNELLGKQNAAVDNLINDTLRSLPAKLAGDIRNAISRSGNKLMALQVELNKRGIRL